MITPTVQDANALDVRLGMATPQLLKAAPDMYAALRAAADRMSALGCRMNDYAYRQVWDAIDKAEGRGPVFEPPPAYHVGQPVTLITPEGVEINTQVVGVLS